MSDIDPETCVAMDILRLKCPDYMKVVQHYPHHTSIVVDYKNLQAAGPLGIKLADRIKTDPKYTVSCLENAFFELSRINHGDEVASRMLRDVRFRFINLPWKKRIRMIRAGDVNQLLAFEGICRMASPVKPKIITAIFRCKKCGHSIRVPQRSRVLEPPEDAECPHCNSHRWVHEIQSDVFANSQYVTIQEYHEGLKAAEQPYSVGVELMDDLCGVVNAGFRTTVNGILRVTESKGKSLVVNTFVEANMVELGDQSFTDVQIGDADVEKIRALAALPNVHEVLACSVAPSIYGHDLVKTALVLQLFGGVTRTEKSSRIRGDIHILLLGDPGIAKSQMLDYISLVSPRGVKAMGGQSTGAGLTCAAKQDGSGEWALEGGALVLADGGMCCIDEFDKMEKEDRAAIHGAMEQQKIDVNKAGINATLMTRCSVLAAANPKSGRWDMFKNLTEQVELPPSLLSRFDLIFILRDIPNGLVDDKIADHILEGVGTTDAIPVEMLRKYVAYAKREINPKRNAAANKLIKEFYLKLRGLGKDGTVPITPRKLEDLKRLCEASARVRLSPVADEMDAKIAIQLVDACLRDVAYDSKSGKFDIDKVICNTSSAQRSHIAIIRDVLATSGKKAVPIADIYTGCIEYLNKQECDIALERMQLNCWISISRDKEVTLL